MGKMFLFNQDAPRVDALVSCVFERGLHPAKCRSNQKCERLYSEYTLCLKTRVANAKPGAHSCNSGVLEPFFLDSACACNAMSCLVPQDEVNKICTDLDTSNDT